jgi:predicted histidine transporter YuiF (NhaC family)
MVFWAMSLITWVVLRVFTDLDKISTNVVTALSIVVGLLTTVIGFYNYQRKLDKEQKDANTAGDMEGL